VLEDEQERRALSAWVRERGSKPGPLFPSNWKRPISRQRLDQLMRKYGAAAGLPADKQHFHAIRHSCAVQLLEDGANIEQVQDHLGHREIRSTTVSDTDGSDNAHGARAGKAAFFYCGPDFFCALFERRE
jgi:site-specific recombinase XerD